VDGFSQDQFASKSHEDCEVRDGFRATHSNPLESLQLTDGLFDPRASTIESLGQKVGFVLGIRAVRNHWNDPSFPASRAIALGVVAFVGHRRPWRDVGTDVERCCQLGAVADFAAGQVEADRQSVKAGLEMDFAGNPPRECLSA
jgi:hypothetical protein